MTVGFWRVIFTLVTIGLTVTFVDAKRKRDTTGLYRGENYRAHSHVHEDHAHETEKHHHEQQEGTQIIELGGNAGEHVHSIELGGNKGEYAGHPPNAVSPVSPVFPPNCLCVVKDTGCIGREEYTKPFLSITTLTCGHQFQICCFEDPWPGIVVR